MSTTSAEIKWGVIMLLNRRYQLLWCLWILLAVPALASAETRTIARCGEGWLEEIDGSLVLHLKGTPYEMGYQHGSLLKDHATSNITNIRKVMDEKKTLPLGPLVLRPTAAVAVIQEIQKPYVPEHFHEELQGLADGSGMPLSDCRFGNFLPELFHCSGFALMNSATANGQLLHGRVLDYAVDWGLQEHAVVMVCEPEGKIPFVNISYAGFIGSVTGMNAQHVSIGEMGGRGLGHWEGVPMAFLVREALSRANNLDEAIDVFRNSPRTCEYFYVLADGKNNRAVGMEASWNVLQLIQPGEAEARLPTPVVDCSLLSVGDRYNELVRRVQAGHGKFTAESALRLMDSGVAMKSNLHNVLFEPLSTRFWVAHASPDGKPAAEQPYAAFQLTELLSRRPDPNSPVLPGPEVAAASK
ncbi:C45 family autoproteolytic acyltransferase/hydolase [Planctomicrobium sp. SH664]|uniref:C45 family autoproteolytic acyltransferase/hydolase n=1 Tax=Planctomicrobium sp. SH664 TaxID=3448125 RepID=UPI003F5C2C1D